MSQENEYEKTLYGSSLLAKWEDLVISVLVILLDKYRYTHPQCEALLQKAFAKVTRAPFPKVFKVFRISENTNSFGLYGHWLMARDGETWEVARHQRWEMGQFVTTLVNPNTGEPDWVELGCEIPERKAIPGIKGLNAPPHEVIAEVWTE